MVFDGLPGNLTLEQGKSLISPLTVDGACAMCHIVGVTPDTPTLKVALGGKQPKEVVKVRGMFVVARQAEQVLSNFDQISRFQIVVGRKAERDERSWE